jgi:hypothetical protein
MTEYRFRQITTDEKWDTRNRAGHEAEPANPVLRIYVGKNHKLADIPLSETDLLSIIGQCAQVLALLSNRREKVAK